ncbi:MAG: cysteine hydrolase [Gammaproteobacteria bacterium]|nr:cysteine hydrolase [Gammaproteobacteria bacterium]
MKSAVLVTDVQAKIFDTSPQPFEADEVVQRINHVTTLARAAGVPVFFIQHESPGYLDPASEGWRLQKDLIVKDSDIRLRKTTGDAFLRTDLEEKLTLLNVTTLIICGYASEFCIDNTTRRATGLGYTVQLVSDAHTTHEKKHLSAKKIREHHNLTLSMGPTITAVQSEDISIEG